MVLGINLFGNGVQSTGPSREPAKLTNPVHFVDQQLDRLPGNAVQHAGVIKGVMTISDGKPIRGGIKVLASIIGGRRGAAIALQNGAWAIIGTPLSVIWPKAGAYFGAVTSNGKLDIADAMTLVAERKNLGGATRARTLMEGGERVLKLGQFGVSA